MVASGAFGGDGFGAGLPGSGDVVPDVVVLKMATLVGRSGNRGPRWWPAGFRWIALDGLYLNSVGLGNPGLSRVGDDSVVRWSGVCSALVLSLASDSLDGWTEIAGAVAWVPDLGRVRALELNLSCPNLGSVSFACSLLLTSDAVSAVCREVSQPVWAKLAPNVPDVELVAQAAAYAGADAVTVSNTLPVFALDVETGFSRLGGGLGRAFWWCPSSRAACVRLPGESRCGNSGGRRWWHFEWT